MGKRGPAPTPTKLKILRGQDRGDRLNRSAPKPSGGGPTMPSGMTKSAQKIWRRQVRAMPPGVLTVVDGDCLRVYCEAVSRYTEAAAMLAESGPLAVGQKRNLVRNPLAQIVRDNAQLIRLFGKDLGFQPSAREGLHTQSDERDPLADWIDDSG